MRLSFKLAVLAALYSTAQGARSGLSLSDYSTILSTDANKIIEESTVENLWETLSDYEWERSIKTESRHREGLRASSASHRFPFVVCSSEASTGNKIRKRVESHFVSSAAYILHNSEDKRCFLVSAPASVARSAPEDMTVQPHFAEMKMAKGSLQSLVEESHMGKLDVMLCPGHAETHIEAANIASNIFNKKASEEERIVVEKARLLSATAESREECNGVMPLIEGGYKGESVRVELPTDTPPSCLHYIAEVLSSSPQVCYVEVTRELKLLNEPSQWILQSGVEDSKPWFDVGIDGTGQVVTVSDSGVDMNNCYFNDPGGNINKWGIANPRKRKVIQYVPHISASDDALIGHGTHVCGTVAGRKYDGGDSETTGIADGIAREAKLTMIDVGVGPLVLPPFRIENLFKPGQRAGAKIHSASWGGPAGEYNVQNRGFDSYSSDNPDLLIVVAAGNSGAKCTVPVSPCPDGLWEFDIPETVGSPGNSKNIISVGATESFGEELNEANMLGFDYLAYFSSRGPTADGRTKPDILAPGYNIVSAKSHGRSGESSCDGDDGTKFMAGTSMATPAVSGTAALVRQYFEDGYYPSGEKTFRDKMMPSSALVKAVLMNGAQFLKGINNMGDVSDVAPYDNAQNFGRVNLMNSLHLSGSGNMKMIAIEDTIEDDEKNMISVTIALTEECTSKMLSATLVWTDKAGFPGCTRCLTNDLDLVVVSVSSSITAKDIAEKTVFPNGLESKDSVNNAERVQVDVEDGQTLKVVVSGTNLSTDEQDYALVITGCF